MRRLWSHGVRGDIDLLGADCAEDFDLAEPADPDAVLCVDDDERVRRASAAAPAATRTPAAMSQRLIMIPPSRVQVRFRLNHGVAARWHCAGLRECQVVMQ